MTDTAFYAEMDQLATELLTDFGSPATYRSFPPKPKPNAEGIVINPAPVDKPGLAVRTTSEEVLKMFEQTATVVMVVKFPVEPSPDGRIIHANEVWKPQEIKPVKPLGTAMIVAFVSCVKP
jgi:hypothetical protein